ncbi:MAG: hypothetical protein Q9167_003292 [Letrouitia subvulpina]
MTMIKVKNEGSGEELFDGQNSQRKHVSRGQRRRPMTPSVRFAGRNCTGGAGQNAIVINIHEKGLIEVIIHPDLQVLGPEIYGVVVPILRKHLGYHPHQPNNGDSIEPLQLIGGRLNRSHEENVSVQPLLQRKRKTDSFSMLFKRHKLTDREEVEKSFSCAAAEDDRAVSSSENDGSVPPAEEYSQIEIGDKKAVRRFYKDRLMLIGQANLKGILKAWIKVIEPKKQSLHPYNGGNTAEESKMRFGEHNPERLVLAMKLLCDEGWVVDMLRKSTETLSLDTEATTLLEEMYDTREKQEQLSDGAIVLQMKKRSTSTRQFSDAPAIAIGNELPIPSNNVAHSNLPGSDNPSTSASARFHQQCSLQDIHVGATASSFYSDSNAQISVPMPISSPRELPFRPLPTAAVIPDYNMAQTMSYDGNPIPQGYGLVRSQSVMHEQSTSYDDWGESGHRQHDFPCDFAVSGYISPQTSFGYPLSGLPNPLSPLNLPTNQGRTLRVQMQLAQMQPNLDDGSIFGEQDQCQHGI